MDPLAAEDQAHAGIRTLAGRVGTYRIPLILAGFQPDEAFELCRDYALEVIGRSSDEEDPS